MNIQRENEGFKPKVKGQLEGIEVLEVEFPSGDYFNEKWEVIATSQGIDVGERFLLSWSWVSQALSASQSQR
jgi:hypothetical protein